MTNSVRCPLCLEADACTLKLDRKGRPYLHCRWCESRSFLGNAAALTTIVLCQPELARLVDAGGGSRALQGQAEATFASRKAGAA